MANARKLGQEIERTLKKVQEGLDQFDEIWNKVYEGDMFHVKDKLEGDLKKEIKKLQRLRDQIKTWVSSNEVKDKEALMEARRKIERQMEKFKECEKEMKTKAFSKEGLGRMQKVDPREKEKAERTDWLKSKVDQLQELVENNEAEQEALLSTQKKKEPPSRVRELADINARHKKHVERLEQILRALDNETIQYEKVDDIRENFEYYLENHESDEEGVDDVDNIYADLLDVLDAIEVHVPIVVDKPAKAAAVATAATPDTKKTKAEKEAEREKERIRVERERERASVQVARAQLAGQTKGPAPAPEALLDDKAGVPRPLVVPTTAAAVELTSPTRVPQARAAAKDAPPPATQATLATAAAQRAPQTQQPAQTPAAAAAHTSVDSTTSSRGVLKAGMPVPAPPPGLGGAFQGQAAMPSVWGSRGDHPQEEAAPAAAAAAPAPAAAAAMPAEPRAAAENLPASFAPFTPGGPFSATMGPSVDASLVAAVAPVARADVFTAGTSPLSYLDILHACMHTGHAIPLPHDGAWKTRACARKGPRPYGLPESYPTQSPAVLGLPAMWEGMTEVEDLFAAFYLTPGTNSQFYAARELKRRNWRYHKQLGAWFQRHQDPRESTDEYETGDYIYFDYKLADAGDGAQQGWVFRMKQSFLFRYDQLENELSA